MSKECETARNMVVSAMVILAVLIVILSMSSCGSINQCGEMKLKKCCKKNVQAVYEYEGLMVK